MYYGWYDAGNFLLKYGCNDFNGIKKGIGRAWWNCRAKEAIAFQIAFDKDGKEEKRLLDNYNVTMLVKCVGKNPQLLKRYPQLEQFFYGNGQLKSDMELATSYCLLEKEYPNISTRKQVDSKKSVYREFLYYRFKQGDLQMPNSNDEIAKKIYADVCKDLILNYLESLQYAFDYQFEDEEKDDYEAAVKLKINVIGKITDVLKKVDKEKQNENSLIPYITETFRVYETAKKMYKKMPTSIDENISLLKSQFSISQKIEPREPDGRDSAMNI